MPDNAEHGTTTNNPDSVNPATGTPKGSIATAETGYAFKNWTKDGVVVSWNAELTGGHREGGRPVCGIRIRSELRSG